MKGKEVQIYFIGTIGSCALCILKSTCLFSSPSFKSIVISYLMKHISCTLSHSVHFPQNLVALQRATRKELFLSISCRNRLFLTLCLCS